MFQEDLSPFFDADELATTATLDGTAVAGIVRAGFQGGPTLEYGHARSQAGITPTFVLQSASVPASPLGKALVIASGPAAGSWRVADATHDGTGLCTLLLTAA